MAFLLCFLFLFMISSASACDGCTHHSKVAYFISEYALSTGACGYGPLAPTFYDGHIAGAVHSIYKYGAGCGSCFEIRCKDAKLCNKEGTKVVVTDLNGDHRADFVLSSKAYVSMANKGMSEELLKLGIVDVEYKRIPCDYKDKNLAIWVEESTKRPYYLAIKLLYQGGQTEIKAIYVSEVGSDKWEELKRNYGAVWDISKYLSGALQFKFVGCDGKVYLAKNVLPADCKVGEIYDTGLQILDIACSPCDDGKPGNN